MFFSLALHVLSVAVLALVVEIACRACKLRPALCHALWLLILVKLMVPPVVVWPWALPEAGLKQFVALETLAPLFDGLDEGCKLNFY